MTTEPIANRFVLAGSWWVASELVRRNPRLQLIETHPGGGQYDCLSLVHKPDGSWKTLIDLNRAGRMHVHDVAGDQVFEPLAWDLLYTNEDAHDVVKQLEAAAGLRPRSPAPPTGGAALTYRVIARLMAGLVNDRHRWDVRNEQHDSSGWEGGPNNYVSKVPHIATEVDRRRDTDVLGVARYRYWALLRDGAAHAVFDTDGAVHLPNGSSRNMLEAYRAHDRSLTAVIGAALSDVLP